MGYVILIVGVLVCVWALRRPSGEPGEYGHYEADSDCDGDSD